MAEELTMAYMPQFYPNYLDRLPFDYDALLSRIEENPCYAPGPSVEYLKTVWFREPESVERWGSYMSRMNPVPMTRFVETFHSFIDANGRIPTQQEFRENYFRCSADHISKFLEMKTADGMNRDGLVECISARCDRTYPSMLRDIEFALLLRKLGAPVVYNEKLDADMAIDLMINVPSGHHYGIHLFTDTERAEEFRREKDHRHNVKFSNVIEIDHMINMDKPETNGVKLYDQNDVISLFCAMKEKSKFIA